MRRDKRISRPRLGKSYKKEIRYSSDYQLDWVKLVPTLRKFTLERVDFLSIAGDAPKDFVTDSEARPGHRTRSQRNESYIAKVGSKFYPNESITEQLITRIGEIYDLEIAESKLRLIDGQVRFMSKYFLDRRTEQLTHGAEIYELCLGKENYAELADKKAEREYFTFQMTCEAINTAFPDSMERIVRGFVEMLAFDAIIGHNDRHPYNWGVVVPVQKDRAPRFSPVYDTARALFWNVPEKRVQQMLSDQKQLETYVNKCVAPIGWDGEQSVDFFRLIGLIWNGYKCYRKNIEKFLPIHILKKSCRMLDKEFCHLISAERCELIKRCLHLRQKNLLQAVDEFRGREEPENAT